MKKTMTVLSGIVLLITLSSTKGYMQERIDDWYGKEMTELHAQLNYTERHYGERFKYKNYGDGKESLTMTDYRGVKCEYISLDYGWTVKYRVDHYSKKEYEARKTMIMDKWDHRDGSYILRGKVVAMFDDKERRVGFALVKDMPNFGNSFGSTNNQDNLKIIIK